MQDVELFELFWGEIMVVGGGSGGCDMDEFRFLPSVSLLGKFGGGRLRVD